MNPRAAQLTENLAQALHPANAALYRAEMWRHLALRGAIMIPSALLRTIATDFAPRYLPERYDESGARYELTRAPMQLRTFGGDCDDYAINTVATVFHATGVLGSLLTFGNPARHVAALFGSTVIDQTPGQPRTRIV